LDGKNKWKGMVGYGGLLRGSKGNDVTPRDNCFKSCGKDTIQDLFGCKVRWAETIKRRNQNIGRKSSSTNDGGFVRTEGKKSGKGHGVEVQEQENPKSVRTVKERYRNQAGPNLRKGWNKKKQVRYTGVKAFGEKGKIKKHQKPLEHGYQAVKSLDKKPDNSKGELESVDGETKKGPRWYGWLSKALFSFTKKTSVLGENEEESRVSVLGVRTSIRTARPRREKGSCEN